MINNLHRLDLLKQFPKYDYSNPVEPWLIDYRRTNNITAIQITSFHYYWANKMCADTGQMGISLIIPGIPNCICVAPKELVGVSIKSGVHIVNPLENLVNLFQPESISLIIISSALTFLPCSTVQKDASPEVKQRRFCRGEEIVPIIREWARLLILGGVIIANIVDESFAREAGWNLFEKDPKINHVFTPRSFEEHIANPLANILEIEEINNLANHFSFNVVLSRKDR